MVQGAGADPHENLVRLGRRDRRIFIADDLGTAALMDSGNLHRWEAARRPIPDYIGGPGCGARRMLQAAVALCNVHRRRRPPARSSASGSLKRT